MLNLPKSAICTPGQTHSNISILCSVVSLVAQHEHRVFSSVHERGRYTKSVPLFRMCICSVNHCAFAVFLSLCVHVPAYWQPAWQWQSCAGSLPEQAQMPVLSVDWTPLRGDVISNASSPLSVRTAGGCRTKASDYSYFYCYIMWCISSDTHTGTVTALPVCVGKACGKYCGTGRSVLSGCMVTSCTISGC